MRNTINAREFYQVTKGRHKVTNEVLYGVYDGEQLLFAAERRSYEDYLDEKEGNEMFHLCEVFTTKKGNQFIYWRDEEIDKDFLNNIEDQKRKQIYLYLKLLHLYKL